jgi:hypothetical protein
VRVTVRVRVRVTVRVRVRVRVSLLVAHPEAASALLRPRLLLLGEHLVPLPRALLLAREACILIALDLGLDHLVRARVRVRLRVRLRVGVGGGVGVEVGLGLGLGLGSGLLLISGVALEHLDDRRFAA